MFAAPANLPCLPPAATTNCPGQERPGRATRTRLPSEAKIALEVPVRVDLCQQATVPTLPTRPLTCQGDIKITNEVHCNKSGHAFLVVLVFASLQRPLPITSRPPRTGSWLLYCVQHPSVPFLRVRFPILEPASPRPLPPYLPPSLHFLTAVPIAISAIAPRVHASPSPFFPSLCHLSNSRYMIGLVPLL